MSNTQEETTLTRRELDALTNGMPALLKAKIIRTLECAARALLLCDDGETTTKCRPDPTWPLGPDAEWSRNDALSDHLRAVAEEARRS